MQLLDGDGTDPDLASTRFGTLHTGETLLTGVPPGTYDVSVGCADAQTIPDLTLPAGELVDVVTLESAPPAGIGLIERLPTPEPDVESCDGVFCPTEPVTREQMATFLVRALDL